MVSKQPSFYLNPQQYAFEQKAIPAADQAGGFGYTLAPDDPYNLAEQLTSMGMLRRANTDFARTNIIPEGANLPFSQSGNMNYKRPQNQMYQLNPQYFSNDARRTYDTTSQVGADGGERTVRQQTNMPFNMFANAPVSQQMFHGGSLTPQAIAHSIRGLLPASMTGSLTGLPRQQLHALLGPLAQFFLGPRLRDEEGEGRFTAAGREAYGAPTSIGNPQMFNLGTRR